MHLQAKQLFQFSFDERRKNAVRICLQLEQFHCAIWACDEFFNLPVQSLFDWVPNIYFICVPIVRCSRSTSSHFCFVWHFVVFKFGEAKNGPRSKQWKRNALVCTMHIERRDRLPDIYEYDYKTRTKRRSDSWLTDWLIYLFARIVSKTTRWWFFSPLLPSPTLKLVWCRRMHTFLFLSIGERTFGCECVCVRFFVSFETAILLSVAVGGKKTKLWKR